MLCSSPATCRECTEVCWLCCRCTALDNSLLHRTVHKCFGPLPSVQDSQSAKSEHKAAMFDNSATADPNFRYYYYCISYLNLSWSIIHHPLLSSQLWLGVKLHDVKLHLIHFSCNNRCVYKQLIDTIKYDAYTKNYHTKTSIFSQKLCWMMNHLSFLLSGSFLGLEFGLFLSRTWRDV